eukprot:TRINITY_DN7530_c0_g1_i1.p1 TRINITY_DN7530_c0_g1~~TRINITY_DN7530_c0_g1_i1.p1  ORF type:complete len:193 (+),score=18.01 TRINITY_DN7530_c0_g1_i1:238-816(+)
MLSLSIANLRLSKFTLPLFQSAPTLTNLQLSLEKSNLDDESFNMLFDVLSCLQALTKLYIKFDKSQKLTRVDFNIASLLSLTEIYLSGTSCNSLKQISIKCPPKIQFLEVCLNENRELVSFKLDLPQDTLLSFLCRLQSCNLLSEQSIFGIIDAISGIKTLRLVDINLPQNSAAQKRIKVFQQSHPSYKIYY